MLNGLDLFSGIGGLTLALSEYVRPMAYCEQDRYCQGVLMSRMHQGQIGIAPIWDDVRTLRGEALGPIDIIYGGFPCQDISAAGHGVGLAGERSGLYFELQRLIGELRPSFVFLENVSAISFRGLERISLELTSMGYDSRWTIVSAGEVGACHRRERWFLLAHSPGPGREREDGKGGTSAQELPKPAGRNGWTSKPIVCGRNHGIPYRRDRLRGLGNAVVPLQAKVAFKRLCGLA